MIKINCGITTGIVLYLLSHYSGGIVYDFRIVGVGRTRNALKV